MQVAKETYSLIKKLPKTEVYIIGDQMRRAAISIPSNIAEGHGRLSNKEFLRFLSIARGSKAELETQLELCVNVGFFSNDDIAEVTKSLDELGKMMYSLMQKLANK